MAVSGPWGCGRCWTCRQGRENDCELMEVLELARHGAVTVNTERFALDDAPGACERLEAGAIGGRAVIVPEA